MSRVLHLIDTTGPGGAETIFLSLIGGLAKKGWSSLPVVRGPGWVRDSLVGMGYDPRFATSGRSLDVSYVRTLYDIIRDERVDLVQSHLLTTSLYGGLAATIAGIPIVSTFHGLPDLEASPIKYHLLNRLVDRFVFVSGALRGRAVSSTALNKADGVVIHNGIHLGDFGPRQIRREGIRESTAPVLVGAVGNVRPLKDYPTLLKAAALVEMSAPGRCRFLVAGATDAPSFQEILDLRASLGLESAFRFVGFEEDVPSFLRRLDIFVLSSTNEGFSLATIQAMATGLPVVATRSGGPEEILNDGETGILVPPGDPDLLAKGILRLVENKDLAARLGRTARLVVGKEYTIDSMVRKYEELYRRVLAGNGGGRVKGKPIRGADPLGSSGGRQKGEMT